MDTMYIICLEDCPKTLAELERRFLTDDDCHVYLSSLRWSEGFVCPRCEYNQAWQMANGYLVVQKLPTSAVGQARDHFQDSHIPLVTWFRAMWYICVQNNGASVLGSQHNLGLGNYYRKERMILHKLRTTMVHYEKDCLSGTIEVDEPLVGGIHEGKRGRGASGKTIVVVAAERNNDKMGRIRMMSVQSFSADSLENAVELICEPGSTIITDGLNSYSVISRRGYSRVIDDTENSSDKHALPYYHVASNLLKRRIIRTLQGSVGQEHIQDYLNEFVFRFNRRKSASRGKLFYRLAQHSVISEPITFRSLTQRKRD